MQIYSFPVKQKKWITLFLMLLPFLVIAQTTQEPEFYPQNRNGVLVMVILTFLAVLGVVTFLYVRIQKLLYEYKINKKGQQTERMKKYIDNLNSEQIEKLFEIKKNNSSAGGNVIKTLLIFLVGWVVQIPAAFAQDKLPVTKGSLFSEAGIIITIFLLLIPILAGIALMYVKISRMLKRQQNEMLLKEADNLAQQLRDMPEEELKRSLESRLAALNYRLSGREIQ